jgi:subtilase family serine protease
MTGADTPVQPTTRGFTLKKAILGSVIASTLLMPIGASAAGASPAAAGVRASCATAPPGYASCFALVSTPQSGLSPLAAPAGYHPADLISAYKLPTGGVGQTVAIVDAFDNPNAESDLGVYRSTFGLPACTTANGCFKKVNQTGGTVFPPSNAGWAEEISLDVDMVSAVCPNCHILLVEANDNRFVNLGASVNEAAALGANAISNSYGGPEFSGEGPLLANYNHPGVAVTASSGDNGFAAGTQIPAASTFVTAVGGTRLTRAPATTRGFKETVWSLSGGHAAGSGCSAFVVKPSWQTDPGCGQRTIADVSAVADPATGVTVFDTFGPATGFEVFGGTSASSPIIASVYALAGNEAGLTYGSFSYSHRASLFDVKKGSTGACGGSYLCTGKPGYDGPTGNGTPNGTGAF